MVFHPKVSQNGLALLGESWLPPVSPHVAGVLGRGGGGEVGQAWATCSLELVPEMPQKEVAQGRVGEAGVVRLVQVCSRCPSSVRIEGRGTAGTYPKGRAGRRGASALRATVTRRGWATLCCPHPDHLLRQYLGYNTAYYLLFRMQTFSINQVLRVNLATQGTSPCNSL